MSLTPYSDDTRLTRSEAPEFLKARGFRITKTALEMFATRGNGPPYQKWGKRALYRASDLLAWAEARLTPPAQSAAEHRQAGNVPAVSKSAPAEAPARVLPSRRRA